MADAGPESATDRHRRELTPVLARAFAELGYRRATTAELARRCGVRENQLYRVWPNKKAMFLAAIEHVFESAAGEWAAVLDGADGGDGRSPAERILAHHAAKHGESRLHRITFAGLNETDDPEVRDALRRMYRGFHRLIAERVADHRTRRADAGEAVGPAGPLTAATTAWAVIGLGTMSNIAQELGMLGPRQRKTLLDAAGHALLDAE